jgi:hypothetical protein
LFSSRADTCCKNHASIASMIVSFSLKLMNVLPVRHVLIVIMGKASRSSK